MTDLLQTLPAETVAALAPVLELGLNHEQQHQELLLMDAKHVLSRNPMAPAYLPAPVFRAADPGPILWCEIEGGIVEVGHDDQDWFAFDNEGPRHRVLLHPYRLADRLVTNGEWSAFMEDGGYRRPELWLSDGWYRRQEDGWQAPLYWRRDGQGWSTYTLYGERPVDPDEPVCHVSFYEADAYGSWAGCRLPTEAEWEHAASRLAPDDASRSNSGFHPAAVGSGGFGLRQLSGQCWQWTGSAYRPYRGYRPPGGAIGEYNGKFMVNQHVLRGSSAFTPQGHSRSSYRNFFPPDTRWHLSGVRLADDAPTPGPGSVP